MINRSVSATPSQSIQLLRPALSPSSQPLKPRRRGEPAGGRQTVFGSYHLWIGPGGKGSSPEKNRNGPGQLPGSDRPEKHTGSLKKANPPQAEEASFINSPQHQVYIHVYIHIWLHRTS